MCRFSRYLGTYPIGRAKGMGVRNPRPARVLDTFCTFGSFFLEIYYGVLGCNSRPINSTNPLKRYGRYKRYRKPLRGKGFWPYTFAAALLGGMGGVPWASLPRWAARPCDLRAPIGIFSWPKIGLNPLQPATIRTTFLAVVGRRFGQVFRAFLRARISYPLVLAPDRLLANALDVQ